MGGTSETSNAAGWQLDIRHQLLDTPEDGNVDVVVALKNSRQYTATFFTLENLRHLFSKWAESGECLNGLYLWASDMIVVQHLDRRTIERTVEDLIGEGDLEKAFHYLPPSEVDGEEDGSNQHRSDAPA